MPDISVQVQINGRVQGVSYRAWLQQLAGTLGLRGWVRNRHDGWVEAVLSGPEHAIDPALALIERGPPGARVDDVAVRPAEPSELAMIADGEDFIILADL
jgi:acylphosphatase